MMNLQLLSYSTTKLAIIAHTRGIEVGALNRRSMLEKLMYLALVLIS